MRIRRGSGLHRADGMALHRVACGDLREVKRGVDVHENHVPRRERQVDRGGEVQARLHVERERGGEKASPKKIPNWHVKSTVSRGRT